MTRYVLVRRDLIEQAAEILEIGEPDALVEFALGEEVREEIENALGSSDAAPVSPPWEKVRKMAGHLTEIVASRGPLGTAELDQLRAIMRDELDKLEVSLRDEWVLYHGLVWVGMVTELARNGYANGRVGIEAFDTVREITTTIASGLLDFLPPEAKR